MSFTIENMATFTAMPSSYDMSTAQGDFSQPNFLGLENFPFDYPQRETAFGRNDTGRHRTNGFCGSQRCHHPSQQIQAIPDLSMAAQTYQMPELSRHDIVEGPDAHRRPLSDFDHNTHRMLQAQLEQGETCDHDAEEQDLEAALTAASAMDNLGEQNHLDFSHPHRRQQHLLKQERHWEMPSTSLLPLPYYSSYPPKHSHHPPAEEHLAVAMNAEAFEANQLVPALQSHNSDFGNHLGDDNSSVRPDGSHSFSADSVVNFAREMAVKAEGTNDSAEL